MAEDQDQDSGEKAYEASEQKLRKAREKGNVPLSNDFNTFLTIIGYNLLFLSIVVLFRNIFLKLRPFIVNCAEHSAMGWNTEVAIGGADASRATNTQVVIYSKWVTSVGIMQRGQNVEWFALGI